MTLHVRRRRIGGADTPTGVLVAAGALLVLLSAMGFVIYGLHVDQQASSDRTALSAPRRYEGFPDTATVGRGCELPAYPDASCTGVPAGTVLVVVDGDMRVTATGAVVEGKDIRGCVSVQAADVTIRNSKITCSGPYAIASYQSNDDGGLRVEDVEIDCGRHNATGISYRGLTVSGLHVHDCENGLDIDRDVTIRDSYIHNIYEGVTGHGDGIQGSDGSNVLIDHNTIYSGNGTASINLNNAADGPITTNTTISNNLLAGGAYTLYCPIPATRNFRVINNRFSNMFHVRAGEYGPWTDCQDEAQISGNLYYESALPVTL